MGQYTGKGPRKGRTSSKAGGRIKLVVRFAAFHTLSSILFYFTDIPACM